jgi:hypothetical protein
MQMEQIVDNAEQQRPLSVKAIKFRKIAEYRMSRLVRLIAQLSNLSRHSTYDYTAGEIEQMFTVLRAELDAAEEKFSNRQTSFRFD